MQWVGLAKSKAGVSRGMAEEYLKANGVGTGTFCFRTSSDKTNVVLCVRVVSGQVAHMRTQATRNGTALEGAAVPFYVLYGLNTWT